MLKFPAKQRNPSRLAGNALFAGLSTRDLKIVEDMTHARQYLPGEVVFDAGEEAEALYCVLAGQVLICHPGQLEHPIATLPPGTFFGELALLDNVPRSAQARAGAHTELAVLFRGDFERLMESHARIASHIAVQLARYLGQRLRGMVRAAADGAVQ
jgi:CRP/FNR family transcriptional regulator, cyclic AMP receptor protein